MVEVIGLLQRVWISLPEVLAISMEFATGRDKDLRRGQSMDEDGGSRCGALLSGAGDTMDKSSALCRDAPNAFNALNAHTLRLAQLNVDRHSLLENR